MTVDQLIAKLQKLKAEHGNLQVELLNDEWGVYQSIGDIEYLEIPQDSAYPRAIRPARTIIGIAIGSNL